LNLSPYNFNAIGSFFFYTERKGEKRGTREKNKFKTVVCDQTIVVNNINNENYMGWIRPALQ
jgi:hypothetical protein